VFDPFKDFETSGYLRNKFAEKDPQIVQELEHQMFRVSLDEAIAYLAKRRSALRYEDFLAVWMATAAPCWWSTASYAIEPASASNGTARVSQTT
jgi:hypothetical protein